MGLGSRNARRHETVRSQAVRSEDYWDFSPGQRVSTVDGFLGKVVAVEDGPVAGYESYEVELDNGLGGGLYTSGQLRATSDHTGSSPSTAANTASVDYPELAEVLQERKDPGKYPSAGLMMGLASKTASTTAQYYTEDELREVGRKALAEIGGKPGLCPNGHLTWGGECASCRNTDADKNSMVTNPNDHRPQDVEHTRNAAKSASNDTNEHGFGWSSLCEEDPEEEGYCAYHRDYHDEPDPEPEPYCERCGLDGHDEDDHEQTCTLCGNAMKADGRHPYNGVGSNEECPNGRGRGQLIEEKMADLNPGHYCSEHCHSNDAQDIVSGHADNDERVKNRRLQQCVHCGNPLMGSPGDQMSGIADPKALHLLKTNPTGPSRYSALEYGWRMITAARADEDLAFHVTAAWSDVRNKARRIRSEGGVHITTSQNGYVIAQVKGDHGTYESVLLRYPGTQKIGQWDCGCKWAQYHWGAPDDFSRFAGRMCSHALALNFEAQSRGMFGREVKPNEGVPRWLNKHLVERISSRRADLPPSDTEASFLSTFAALAVAAGETPANVATLLSTLGAVSSPFGEPAPKPVPGIDPSGPTERRRQENPASAGFLTTSDPDGWDDSQQPQGLGDRVGAKEIPGLGCPHCSGGFYTMDERSGHIRDEHPGEYQGPTQDIADLFEMRPDLKHQSGLDEAIFEPEMGKEAFLPLLVPAAEALIGAGEAAGAAGAAAGAGEAAGAAGAAGGAGEAAGAGNTLKVLPKVVKALPGLQQGQQKAHQQVGQDRAGGEVAQRNNEAGFEQSFADPWGKNGVLEDQPEPALPETFGADDGEEDPDSVGAVTASTGIPTGVEYSVPSDQGQAGGSLAPGTDLKSDPADLEPEDPSFVSTGSIGSAGSVADIVASFQHTAGAQALGSGPGTSTRDTQDIAAAAAAYLQKEAMAVFTPAQQQELIDEGKDVQAGNLDRLQIEGTHYESLESALADADDDTDGWLA